MQTVEPRVGIESLKGLRTGRSESLGSALCLTVLQRRWQANPGAVKDNVLADTGRACGPGAGKSLPTCCLMSSL
jgi:hypothetical protein